MRNLVMNLALTNSSGHPVPAEHPFTEDFSRYLQAQGLLDLALTFLSAPRCDVPEPRLPVKEDSAHEIVNALLARRRQERARAVSRMPEQASADRTLLAELADEVTLARYDAGELPDEEIDNLARTVLFKDFRAFPRWQMRSATGVDHADHCQPPPGGYASCVDFDTRRVRILSAVGWEQFRAISLVAGALHNSDLAGLAPKVQLVKRDHVGTCRICQTETHGPSCVVSITWNGRLLVREYAL